jgi:beta-galactosidase
MPANLEASVWSEDLRLHSSSAAAVATFASGPLAGKPAAVRNRHGRGTAWYIGCDLPAAALGDIVGAAVAEAGLTVPVAAELPDDVELATRGGYHFLLNHSPEPRTVRLKEQSVDLLSGDSHGPDITLEPYGALVLKNSFDHTEIGN